MLHLNGEYGQYKVEPHVDPAAWKRGQQYWLYPIEDCEGDVIWCLVGPDVGLWTYSWPHVRDCLSDRGIMLRHTRRMPMEFF